MLMNGIILTINRRDNFRPLDIQFGPFKILYVTLNTINGVPFGVMWLGMSGQHVWFPFSFNGHSLLYVYAIIMEPASQRIGTDRYVVPQVYPGPWVSLGWSWLGTWSASASQQCCFGVAWWHYRVEVEGFNVDIFFQGYCQFQPLGSMSVSTSSNKTFSHLSKL